MPLGSILLLCILCIGTGLTEQLTPDFSTEGAQYLDYKLSNTHQVLLPGMRLNCYGVVKNWSALVVVFNSKSSTTPTHQIRFQIWRPTGSGRYQLVGFDEIIPQEDVMPVPANEGRPKDDFLFYHRLLGKMEDRDEDEHNSKEDDKPLYFKPGDILGYFISSFDGQRQMYPTYRNWTESDSPDLAMDMFFTTTTNVVKADCEVNTCSNVTEKISSIVPNIFFTYEELDEDDEVFQNETILSAEDCEALETPVEECPTPSPLPSDAPSPSTSPSHTTPPPPTVAGTTPTPNVNSAQMGEMLLTIIGVSSAGAILILILGGVFIMIVGLAHRKKKSLDDEYIDAPREASNALYSEMNVVDEPAAYASTHRLKNGIYLDQEHNSADPSAPHFSIRTGESVISLSSNGRRHFSISGPVQSNPTSIHKILTPGETPGAMSMQIPRGSRAGAISGEEDQRRSLRVPIGGHQRPPIPSAMQLHETKTCPCRGSMPLKNMRDTQQQMISMPTLSSPSHSPSPYPCPPTPQSSDQPLPYLLPMKPWYKSDYESTAIPEKERYPLHEEEGLYVPTMEERRSAGEDYSRLRHPHHSKGSNGDAAFFEGPDVFNEPASSTNEIYQQLSSWKTREIIRKYIVIHDQIGCGHFATVCLGVWQRPGGEQEVAVKELRSGAQEGDRVRFLQEAAIMSQFNHTNVVKLHGIVTFDEPLLIVMELMPNGDLKNYLNRFRHSPRQRHSGSCTPPPSPESLLPITPSLPHQLLSFCRQVADGMNYLSQKRFVHRDLAARNIFLTKDFTCKIGDFGLARDLGGEDLYQSRGGKIPVKWTAPEALQYQHFTSASDVWSYGMVLFEIWSLGHRPFDACNIEKDVMEVIGSSACQPPPPGCPREMYKLMTLCWHRVAGNRPTFSFICDYLNRSDSNLLRLPTELPSSLSPLATQLGAPLADSKGLYSDLQYRYEESIV